MPCACGEYQLILAATVCKVLSLQGSDQLQNAREFSRIIDNMLPAPKCNATKWCKSLTLHQEIAKERGRRMESVRQNAFSALWWENRRDSCKVLPVFATVVGNEINMMNSLDLKVGIFVAEFSTAQTPCVARINVRWFAVGALPEQRADEIIATLSSGVI